ESGLQKGCFPRNFNGCRKPLSLITRCQSEPKEFCFQNGKAFENAFFKLWFPSYARMRMILEKDAAVKCRTNSFLKNGVNVSMIRTHKVIV
ncbi:mCG145099, partial [Mus musculus]